MVDEKKAHLSFYDETGKPVDIRDGDISMGIDLVKNALHEAMLEKEIEEKEKKDTIDSYFRLLCFLQEIRHGLDRRGH